MFMYHELNWFGYKKNLHVLEMELIHSALY